MRKPIALMAVAGVAMAVAVTPAAAQDDQPITEFESTAKIFPKKVGTKKKPRGIKIKGKLKVTTITQGYEPPIVTGGDVLLPKGGVYNGGKYPTCAKRTMTRTDSVRDCPKKSIMGAGKGSAFADTVDAKPDVVFVNGGKKRIWAFTTLYNPVLVQEPIAINIKKLKSKKWGYSAKFKVPKNLQVVAGVPVTLRSFNFTIGGKKYAKNYIVTTGGCKRGKYPYQATAHYLYNNNTTSKSTYKGSVACKK